MHGLGSDPDSAWLGRRSKANWLADFLPVTYKNMRIIAVNHDSRWDAHSPVQSLRDYGQVILDSIAALRLAEEVRRYQLFVLEAHSFHSGKNSSFDFGWTFFWRYTHQKGFSHRKGCGTPRCKLHRDIILTKPRIRLGYP